MKVPEYGQQVKAAALPGVRQSIQTSASDFLDPTAALLEPVGRAAHVAGNEMMQQYQAEKTKADRLRAEDASIQLQQYDQDAAYGKTGWRNVLGKDVFSQQNSKPLTDNVIESRQQFISDLTQGLGNEDQKALFNQYAGQSSTRLREHLLSHEAEQYRRYQKSTLEAGIATELKASELEYNDFPMMAQRHAKIRQYHEELAGIEGLDSAYGKAKADGAISQSLKNAVNAALQHGGIDTARGLVDKFSGVIDANDATDMRRHIGDNYIAGMAQNAPAILKQQLEQYGNVEQAILSVEGGQDNFDANGQPAVSSDGKSIGKYQVTDATASAPGFGIAPAKARTHDEYNRIGKELIAKLGEHYAGDPEKIAAAYNAGSGAVDRAIAQGGDHWQEHLPASTRDQYLPRFGRHLKTGTPVDDLNPEQRLRAMRVAEANEKIGMAAAAQQLETRNKNQYAQTVTTGVPGNLISQAEFQQAYGDKADEKYAGYLHDLDFGKTLYGADRMTVDQQRQALASTLPPNDDPDYADKLAQHGKLSHAIDVANTARNKDPMLWARDKGFDVQPLNFDNPGRAAAEIAKRKSVAEKLSTAYGTGYALLSKDEANALSDVIRTTSDDNVLKVLKGFRDGLQDDNAYHATIQQLRQDSPATIVAGHLIGQSASHVKSGVFSDTRTDINGDDVARTILLGERRLNPDKDSKQEDGKGGSTLLPADLNNVFYDKVGTALGDPVVENATLQAVSAYYAGKMNPRQGKVLDQDLAEEAIRNVTGGIVTHGGQQVVPPYGMTESFFIDQAHTQYAAQTGDTSRVNFNNMPLVMIGNGQYAFKSGDGYFTNKDGKLVVVNLK